MVTGRPQDDVSALPHHDHLHWSSCVVADHRSGRANIEPVVLRDLAMAHHNQPLLFPGDMDPLPPSTLGFPSSSPNHSLFWEMSILEADNPVQPKYQEQQLEPIYNEQILESTRQGYADLEFLTPVQPGLDTPHKASSLPEMNLPSSIIGHQFTTPAATPCAPIPCAPVPHTPVTPPSVAGPASVPPVLTSLPASSCSAEPALSYTKSGSTYSKPASSCTKSELVYTKPGSSKKRTSSSFSGKVRKPVARTRRSSGPRKTSPKDIPTNVGDFRISPELKCDLAGGPVVRGRRKVRHTESETDELIDRLYDEAEEHAIRRKMEVRVHMKDELDAVKKDLNSRDRGLLRSRREAKVSRVKTEEFSKALKRIIHYLIMNTDTRRPDPCHCRNKHCGKRPGPSS